MATDTKINVLQIGQQDWQPEISNLDSFTSLNWQFLDLNNFTDSEIKLIKKKPANVTIFSDEVPDDLFRRLDLAIDAYSLVIDEKQVGKIDPHILDLKLPQIWNLDDKKWVIETIARDFFTGQFGAYLGSYNINVSPEFTGTIKQDGEAFLELDGDFSQFKDKPMISWEYNVSLDVKNLSLVLQYEHDEGIEISMILEKYYSGSNVISEVLSFSEEEINKGVTVDGKDDEAYISVSLQVKGQGVLKLGPLHYRMNRHGYGEFLLGGKKVVDPKNKDELFYLYNPGNLKPPLTVYFSGFKGAEGFEGYFMMKGLGTPFLLIADQRMQGGSFYLGSEYLEQQITQAIQDTLDQLGFTNEQLILSGLSMGTFGAMYYAINLQPKYVVIGKPLASIGNIVKTQRIDRPIMDFVSVLDMQNLLEGDLSEASSNRLNERFWQPFKEADFSNTEFDIAYMKNDDYDGTAYHDLLEVLSKSNSNVISKGILGRHNDNSDAIVDWFYSQYKRILRKDYGRRVN